MRIKVVQHTIDKLRGKKKQKSQNKSFFKLVTRGIIEDNNFPIHLSDSEREFLINSVKGANSYLEFGSGGSTYLIVKNTEIKEIVSLDSDINWVEHLKSWKVISDAVKNRLKFITVDIGKVGRWGIPLELEKKELFPNYSLTPFLNNKTYDAVLIDGRFRVACAMQTILNCSNDCIILMHDFNMVKSYHCLLEFLDIVDTCDSIALFKIKKNYDKEKLQIMYQEYKYLYD